MHTADFIVKGREGRVEGVDVRGEVGNGDVVGVCCTAVWDSVSFIFDLKRMVGTVGC